MEIRICTVWKNLKFPITWNIFGTSMEIIQVTIAVILISVIFTFWFAVSQILREVNFCKYTKLVPRKIWDVGNMYICTEWKILENYSVKLSNGNQCYTISRNNFLINIFHSTVHCGNNGNLLSLYSAKNFVKLTYLL